MKLSSISLITAALAAVAGSVTAAPTPGERENRAAALLLHASSRDWSRVAAHEAEKKGDHKMAKIHDVSATMNHKAGMDHLHAMNSGGRLNYDSIHMAVDTTKMAKYTIAQKGKH